MILPANTAVVSKNSFIMYDTYHKHTGELHRGLPHIYITESKRALWIFVIKTPFPPAINL